MSTVTLQMHNELTFRQPHFDGLLWELDTRWNGRSGGLGLRVG